MLPLAGISRALANIKVAMDERAHHASAHASSEIHQMTEAKDHPNRLTGV